MNDTLREVLAVAIIGAALVLIIAATDNIIRHEDESWIVSDIPVSLGVLRRVASSRSRTWALQSPYQV